MNVAPAIGKPLPEQLAADLPFKNAPGIGLDLVTGEIEIAEVDDAVAWFELRSDAGAQEAATLAVGRGDAGAVVADDIIGTRPRHGSRLMYGRLSSTPCLMVGWPM